MPAGDITTGLVSRVRSYIDESTAAFWTDVEIYRALTDSQKEIISFALVIWRQKLSVNPEEKLPEVLRLCIGTNATGTGTASLPTGFLYPLSVYTSSLPVFIRPDGATKGASKFNTYLASSASQPFCSFTASQIVFETSVAWTMEFLQYPANDIDATHDPTLGANAYDAMVEYATAFMLKKDENPRSAQHIQQFFQLLQNLIY